MHQLKRHPFPVAAHFDSCLVLAYAFPKSVLEPLLAPGLTLDTFENFGFVAVALVQTRALRPAFFPAFLGQNFYLCGYRLFARFQNQKGRNLRGLQILRSDTDKLLMVWAGNLFTHYNYHRAVVSVENDGKTLEVRAQSEGANLHVRADLTIHELPPDSPFPDLETARQFAGPMPYTFDFERQTHSMIAVKGVRKTWNPQPVRVEVLQNSFLDSPRFGGATPILANAFYLRDVPYRWERGRREILD